MVDFRIATPAPMVYNKNEQSFSQRLTVKNEHSTSSAWDVFFTAKYE